MALLVEVHRLDDALDGRELVGRVEDLEALRQRGELPVRAQEPVAQAVEGADPHAAHGDREHRVEPRQHLLGGLVGEGHRQHAAGRELAGLDQPGDARRQHARLARAGAGEDQRRLGRQRDGGELFGVEAFEQPGGARISFGKHPAIVPQGRGPPRLRRRRRPGTRRARRRGALRRRGRPWCERAAGARAARRRVPASTTSPATISTTRSKWASRLMRCTEATMQASGKRLVEAPEHQRLGERVERAGRLVEEQHRAAPAPRARRAPGTGAGAGRPRS